MTRYDEDGEEIFDAFDEIKARHKDCDWLIQEVEWLRTRTRVLDKIRDADLERVSQYRALIKVLCADESPLGSEAFRRVQDQLNSEHKKLLLEILGYGR